MALLNLRSLPVVTGVPKSCCRCGALFTDYTDRGLIRTCAACKKPKPQLPRYSSLLLGKPLTHREEQVLDRIAAADPNKEIAYLLCLGEGTIKVMVSTIIAKTGHSNRTRLAVWWVLKAWNASVMPQPEATGDTNAVCLCGHLRRHHQGGSGECDHCPCRQFAKAP